MDPLMLSYWIAISASVLMLCVTLVVAAKLRKTRKHGVSQAQESELQMSDLKSRFHELQDELKKAKSEFSQTQAEMIELKEVEASAHSQTQQHKRRLEEVSNERDHLQHQNHEQQQIILHSQEELKARSACSEELQQALNNEQARVQQLQTAQQELFSQIESFQTQLLYAQEEKENSEETVARQADELRQAHLRHQELQDALSELRSAQESSTVRARESQSQLEVARQENERRKESIAARQKELEELLNENAGLKSVLHEQESANRHLTECNDDISARIEALQTENASLLVQIEEFHRQKKAAQDTIARQQERVCSLERQRDDLAAANDTAQKELNEAQETARALQSRLTEFEQSSQEMQRENQSYLESSVRLEQEHAQAVTERGQLRDELRRSQQRADELALRNEEMSGQIYELQVRLEEALKHGEENSRTVAQQQEELARVNGHNSGLRNTLEQRQCSLAELHQKIDDLTHCLQEARMQCDNLERNKQAQQAVIEELKKEIPCADGAIRQDAAAPDAQALPKEEVLMEVLLDHSLMKRPAADKALELTRKYGGTFIKSLFVHRDIDEQKLVECLTQKFNMPYLPLGMYDTPRELVRIIPRALAEKYWVFPVDKIENKLMVVMVDPFDQEAIAEISRITGCAVKVYIGLLSEVAAKIQQLYKVNIRGFDAEGNLVSPLLISVEGYKGRERRRAVRYEAHLPLQVIDENGVRLTSTEDISLDGLSCRLDQAPAEYANVTLVLNTGSDRRHLPLTAVAQVRKVTAIDDHTYLVGLQFMKVMQEDIEEVIGRISESWTPSRQKLVIHSDEAVPME